MSIEYKDKAEVGKTKSDDDRAIDLVTSCKKESIDYYADKFAQFQYYDWLYEKGAAKRNVPRGRANLELPLAFQQIEPFVDQMMETIVGESPWIAYQGRTERDEPSAEVLTDHAQYQLEVGEFPVALNPFLRNLGKYGTAVMKVIWDKETIEVEEEETIALPKINPETGELEFEAEDDENENAIVDRRTDEIVVHDGPRFINKSLYDFFVPRSANTNNVQKLDWCIDRTFRDINSLIKHPNYKNKKKLRDIRDGKCSGDIVLDPDDPKKEELERNSDKGLEKYEDQVEVLEYWGSFRFSNSKEGMPEAALITIAVFSTTGEKLVLRLDRNPFKYKFKPFAAAVDYPKDGEFYGVGELKSIKGLIEESTALRNARLDIANRSLNPMWLVERASGINVRELYSAPDHIILTNGNSGIRELQMSGVTASSVQELAKIDYDIQTTTNIINPRQDVSNQGAAFGSTATGVSFIASRSNLRTLSKARLFEQTFMKQIGMMLLQYNKELITDEMFFRLTDNPDNPYRSISPDAFASQVDYKPTGNPEKITREQKREQIGYLMQTAAQVENVKPGITNFQNLIPELYKASGFPHSERFVQDPTITVLIGPDGQPTGARGEPVQIVQVDEKGQPLPQGAPQEGVPMEPGTDTQGMPMMENGAIPIQ